MGAEAGITMTPAMIFGAVLAGVALPWLFERWNRRRARQTVRAIMVELRAASIPHKGTGTEEESDARPG